MTKRFVLSSVMIVVVAFSTRVGAEVSTGKKTFGRQRFSFVVAADPHVGQNDGPGYFKAFVKQVERLVDKPEFVLVCGDLYVTPFAKAFDEVKPAIPFHVVAGNHEGRSDRDKLATLFPADLKDRDFYAFTHKNSFFIGLCDATSYGDHVGHFDSEGIRGSGQGQWFEAQLAKNRSKVDHIFIFAHIPPHPKGITGGMFLATNDQKQLKELTLKYKPTALFFGHLHRKMEFKIGDSPVYVLPSLNWNSDKSPRSFLLVKVFKTGITTELIPLDYFNTAERKKKTKKSKLSVLP